MIRISATLILLVSVVGTPWAWITTAALCVFTLILESSQILEP